MGCGAGPGNEDGREMPRAGPAQSYRPSQCHGGTGPKVPQPALPTPRFPGVRQQPGSVRGKPPRQRPCVRARGLKSTLARRHGAGQETEVLRSMAERSLLVYVLVNAFVVVIWAVTDGHGFFWPIFLIAPWGIGLVMNAWDVYWRPQITEHDIQREIEREDKRA